GAKPYVAGKPFSSRFGFGEGSHAGLRSYLPFGSKFFFKSSSVSAHSTPLRGTSACAVHSSAFRTILRKFSLPQFRWKCAPVKPKPRPPSGRSTAHASTSSRPLAATTCGYGPRGEDDLPCRVSSSGLPTRIEVTPFSSGRKRML